MLLVFIVLASFFDDKMDAYGGIQADCKADEAFPDYAKKTCEIAPLTLSGYDEGIRRVKP